MGGMTSHRRPRSTAAPPLEDEDLLSEILLRVPPEPSSLPRASLVCNPWRSLVSDPGFLRRFRLHHRRNAPLLGFFDISHIEGSFNDIYFIPTMDRPNRLPEGSFYLPAAYPDYGYRTLLGCRDGLVLILHLPWRCPRRTPPASWRPVLVWDPVSGDKHHIAFPRGFEYYKILQWWINGAVLRRAGLDHFQVILLVPVEEKQNRRLLAWVYSSETGEWGDPISTLLPSWDFLSNPEKPAVLAGNSLYWILVGSSSSIIEFGLDRARLAVIPVPRQLHMIHRSQYSILRAEDGGLGFIFLLKWDNRAVLYNWKTHRDGVGSWAISRIIEIDKLLSLNAEKKYELLCKNPNKECTRMLGFAENNNVIVLETFIGLFMIELGSLQLKELPKTNGHKFDVHAFESVYVAGTGMDGGHGGPEVLHNA